MAASVSALLEILGNPENPAFEAALAQLATFSPQGLSNEDATALLATIDTLTLQLQGQQSAVAQELRRLRGQFSAAQAYQGRP